MAYDIGGGGGKATNLAENNRFALAKPYELEGEMTPNKMANLDEMLQQLYESNQRLLQLLIDGGFTSASGNAKRQIRQIGITVDGSGSVLTTGVKGYRSCPWAGTMVAARIFADQAGSIVFTLARTTYLGFPPGGLVASIPMTAAQKAQATIYVPIAADDVFGFTIESVSTITRATLELTIVEGV